MRQRDPRFPRPAASALFFAILIALMVSGGASCGSGWTPGRLVLELPPCPESWRGLCVDRSLALTVYRVDATGRSRLATALPFGSSLEVPAPEADFAVFLAEPVGRSVSLKPAGAVYPFRAQGGRLALDFTGGWSAAFAARLCALDPGLAASFNYARLEDQAAQRLSDPWLCPPEALAEIAASGSFNVYRIKAREAFALSLGLPRRSLEGQPLWLPESPFAPPLIETSGCLMINLPEGESVLYRGGERLSVIVDGKGNADALLMPD